MRPVWTTIEDTRTAVHNSGYAKWEWGGRDAGETLDRLTAFLWQQQLPVDERAVAFFVEEVLGELPSDYGLRPWGSL